MFLFAHRRSIGRKLKYRIGNLAVKHLYTVQQELFVLTAVYVVYNFMQK